MDNLDLVVLRTLRDWRSSGKRAILTTIVRTWGSSPRPVGSIMALCEDGSVVGSVSGGCIEDDLIHRYTQAYASGDETRMPAGAPQLLKYGIEADDAHRFGLPCGGTLQLLLEFDPDAESLANIVTRLEQGQLVRRVVSLSDGEVCLEQADKPDELVLSEVQLTNTFGPEYRMLLIGAGQLAEYLASMALSTGFSVVVCDPRVEYRGAWSVPGAKVVSEMPDDVVREFRPDLRTCIITLTHDPKLDDLALLEALDTPAFYIGAIGSRLNNTLRRERLIEHFEVKETALARLRAPVGIYIGSKTPAEIAVSIMAEVLAVKNGVPLPADLAVAAAKDLHGVPPDGGSVSCAI
ncbi:XdhC family protein [Pusillimonas sp. CC-YST705]|uniref:XdhC family protein n=1 Tax=Mesopusillimonas faecipullorum TaxID=2755040 RepID=A0ABS8CDL0_9BURK|nr:XdhC family protein [Mesopusillimonas faecipullorum]MCB5364135.1 XdhC family protein [Mesopusillimonas faecipullorum]